MESSSKHPTLAGSVIRVGIAAFLWALFIATMTYFVPRQRRTFDDFQMPLPTITKIVVDVSMWFADFWWILIPFAIVGLVVALAITWLIRQRIQSRVLSVLWTLLLLAPPVLLNLTVWFGLQLAWMKLHEGLDR